MCFLGCLLNFHRAALCKQRFVGFHCFVIGRGVDIPQFIHSVDECFSLQFGALTHNTGVNVFPSISYLSVGISVKCIPRSGIG